MGFRLALDDFVWKPGIEPLVDLADYIKVDFVLTRAKERNNLLQRLRNMPWPCLRRRWRRRMNTGRRGRRAFR